MAERVKGDALLNLESIIIENDIHENFLLTLTLRFEISDIFIRKNK